MTPTRPQLVSQDCEVTNCDYDAIESVVMGSSRGRWFLSEYVRRHRHDDTNLLQAVKNNIKKTVDGGKGSPLSCVSSTKGYSPIANQSLTPLRLLQAAPKVVDIFWRGTENDSNMRTPDFLCLANDQFDFKSSV
jgi:hypothetical protein